MFQRLGLERVYLRAEGQCASDAWNMCAEPEPMIYLFPQMYHKGVCERLEEARHFLGVVLFPLGLNGFCIELEHFESICIFPMFLHVLFHTRYTCTTQRRKHGNVFAIVVLVDDEDRFKDEAGVGFHPGQGFDEGGVNVNGVEGPDEEVVHNTHLEGRMSCKSFRARCLRSRRLVWERNRRPGCVGILNGLGVRFEGHSRSVRLEVGFGAEGGIFISLVSRCCHLSFMLFGMVALGCVSRCSDGPDRCGCSGGCMQ